jgi:hypothetical protein
MSMKEVATSAGGAAPGSAIEQLLFKETGARRTRPGQ